MKRSLLIFGAVCVAISLCCWLLIGSPRRQMPTTSALTPASTQTPGSSPIGNSAIAAAPSPIPSTKGKEQIMSEALAQLNHQPIQFYGKVLDQDGAPVAGGKVTGGIMVQTKWMNGEITNHYTTTDGNGLFAFEGLAGRDMSIWLEKSGYDFRNAHDTLFKYSQLTDQAERHKPDVNAPVVFTMWKQKGPEALVHTKLSRASVPVDGNPVAFDLLTGKKTLAGGDVVVRLERNPLHIQRGQPFDWKATIEIPNGGLLEIKDAYPNEAPAEGYKPSLTINMPADSPNWQSSLTGSFYIRSRGGQNHARLDIRMTIDYEPPPISFTFEAYVNPSGSRNLEYEPSRDITAQYRQGR